MRIDTLKLQNFRRFRDCTINFASRLNVLVGINGAGKSSILDALASLLSWYVRRVISPAGIGTGVAINETDIRQESDSALLEIHSSMMEGRSVKWSLVKNRSGGALGSDKSDLKELGDYVREIRGVGPLRSLPVIAHYSVHRAVLGIPLKIRKHHSFDLASVYDESLNGLANFRTFFEWYRNEEDLENERFRDSANSGDVLNSARTPLALVRQALKEFLPDFDNWRIRRSPLRMEVMKGKDRFSVNQLSDGEKNMIAMIGDLARRLAIANPDSANALSGAGVVMIDEIELHLHPAWQKDVLPKLLKTFPNVQFVVTTHSPLVLAQLNAELYRQHDERQMASRRKIEVFGLQEGEARSMLDPETELLLSGEMDRAAADVDEEFDRLLNGECQ